jgi:hypothetical protein
MRCTLEIFFIAFRMIEEYFGEKGFWEKKVRGREKKCQVVVPSGH